MPFSTIFMRLKSPMSWHSRCLLLMSLLSRPPSLPLPPFLPLSTPPPPPAGVFISRRKSFPEHECEGVPGARPRVRTAP